MHATALGSRFAEAAAELWQQQPAGQTQTQSCWVSVSICAHQTLFREKSVVCVCVTYPYRPFWCKRSTENEQRQLCAG